MKQFKILSILLVVCFSSLLFSCGGDDSNDSSTVVEGAELINKAVGVWMCTQSTDTQQGNTYQNLMVGKEITVYANGTYTSTAPSFGYTGTYSVSGNKITAHSDAGGTFVITVTFNGTDMVWQGTASNGVSFKYIFVREGSEQPQAMNFSKELILGGNTVCSWSVKSVNFERAISYNVSAGKTLTFKEDGTCTGFHSMETAWRINNGKIETYYAKTNEPMYVYTLLSTDENQLNVRINGTLDDDLQATLVLTKTEDVVAIDAGSITNEDYKAFYAAIYSKCVDFVKYQQALEAIRTNPNTVHNITAYSQQISNTFTAAYTVINNANLYIEKMTQIADIHEQADEERLAEIKAIRAFVYYNIAMLWGDCPFYTSVISDIDYGTNAFAQTKQADIFKYAYQEIGNVCSKLPNVQNATNGRLIFNQDAGYMLKAALEMTLGYKSAAKTTLDQIYLPQYRTQTRSTVSSLKNTFIWALKLSGVEEYIPVYTFTHNQLFYYEINGNRNGLELDYYSETVGEGSETQEGDVAAEWQRQANVDYGYWAMLKRLNKAQAVTGCQDYELLMPFPASDIALNPNLKQNPGY